jgi:hypothetical protein
MEKYKKYNKKCNWCWKRSNNWKMILLSNKNGKNMTDSFNKIQQKQQNITNS